MSFKLFKKQFYNWLKSYSNQWHHAVLKTFLAMTEWAIAQWMGELWCHLRQSLIGFWYAFGIVASNLEVHQYQCHNVAVGLLFGWMGRYGHQKWDGILHLKMFSAQRQTTRSYCADDQKIGTTHPLICINSDQHHVAKAVSPHHIWNTASSEHDVWYQVYGDLPHRLFLSYLKRRKRATIKHVDSNSLEYTSIPKKY